MLFSGEDRKKKADTVQMELDAPELTALLGEQKAAQLREEVELLGAGREFDMQAVRAGTLSPVFFGSALTNFGVEPFLEAFLGMSPPPLARLSLRFRPT